MRRFAIAILPAALVYAAIAGGTTAGAVTPGIGIVSPPAAGGAMWSDDRMRDAHERLKDILPGTFG